MSTFLVGCLIAAAAVVALFVWAIWTHSDRLAQLEETIRNLKK
jgi:hypothetical protein